ncbi:MAG: hypothetical protein OCC45_04320 [Desulfotalea sp.]
MLEAGALTYNNYSNFQKPTQSAPKQTAEDKVSNENKVNVEVTQNADNVSSGDKSQNSARVNVQGPENTYSAEFSREQLMDSLESNFNRQAIDRMIGTEENNSPVKAAAVLNTDAVQGETANELAEAKNTQNAIATYTSVASNANENNNRDDSESENVQETYLNNQKQQQKQELFFDRVDLQA